MALFNQLVFQYGKGRGWEGIWSKVIQGVVDRRWIRTQKASQGAGNSSLPYYRHAGIVLQEDKIVSNSLIEWQDMCVKAFIHIELPPPELLCKLN